MKSFFQTGLSSFYEAENDEMAVNIDEDEMVSVQPDVVEETGGNTANEKRAKKSNFATLQGKKKLSV